MTTIASQKLMIGLDVGSTTVKAVVVNPSTHELLWSNYRRHETKQPDVVFQFLTDIKKAIPLPNDHFQVFITGSGGSSLAAYIGAKFVQEVNAVALAVERLHPDTGSVIELGGQDAKMIFYRTDPDTGKKKKIPTMNDKCAGGTGAVIDKINAKLGIASDQLCQQRYAGLKIHPVAGKCGVFAETDVNTLQKQGIPVSEIMASLFESIVLQNISVLTRGNTLAPKVLLLGGPNTYIQGMVEAWRHHIPLIWAERNTPLPKGVSPEHLIEVPDNAHLYAALGAVQFGIEEDDQYLALFKGVENLADLIGGKENKNRLPTSQLDSGCSALYETVQELEDFTAQFTPQPVAPVSLQQGQIVSGFLGIDGGSTSTKAVLLSSNQEVLYQAYQLSRNNPIQDTMDVVAELVRQVHVAGASLQILGVGTTGYAKDMLKQALKADVALVETVAHTQAALRYYPDADVICDVGGQDIKIIMLKDGRVKDFRLNTQCSAGNGYFLQSTAAGFGFPVQDFAKIAFSAQRMPTFGYGCAVFMQSDIVDFQRQGWKPAEIMAGLASVLPKNIWLYVCQIPNLARLGQTFVLQGGTQRNLAAVKAQVDFIQSRFSDENKKAKIYVHHYTGVSGAIGAAMEAHRIMSQGHTTSFIGLDAVANIEYQTTTDERTRCQFCKNLCLRTFIDVKNNQNYDNTCSTEPFNTKVPLAPDMSRIIIATCEKGAVEDISQMRSIKAQLDQAKKDNPNYVDIAGKEVWRATQALSVADQLVRYPLTPGHRRRQTLQQRRSRLCIGIPRVLNQYSVNPFFSAYFESLGIKSEHLIYSDFTTEKLYKEGAKRGAIDPCYPSKLAIPHIHNLLQNHHPKHPLHYIFFPMIDCLPTYLDHVVGSRTCTTVASTPEATKAAFTKEMDVFRAKGISFLNPFLSLGNPRLLRKQMFNAFSDILGLSYQENARAIDQGLAILDGFYRDRLRKPARATLDQLVQQQRLGIVVLGRPYHNDPGINHGVLEEFQKLGYPIFSQDALPLDADILDQLFGEEIRRGDIQGPFDITDVWKNAYSENTNRKIWAAKFTARHPYLVALELSSFKCGHGAPIYTVIEEIIERSGTPYFSFKDIDENKAAGSIRIRVETIDYFLKRHVETLRKKQLAKMHRPSRPKNIDSAPMLQAST